MVDLEFIRVHFGRSGGSKWVKVGRIGPCMSGSGWVHMVPDGCVDGFSFSMFAGFGPMGSM